MDHLPLEGSTTCWNCDRPTDATAAITIRSSSGGGVRLSLCAACYRSAYLPLVVDGTLPGPAETAGQRTDDG